MDIPKGEHLLIKGQANERLYLVLSGMFECVTDHSIDAFPGSLLGLQSFFAPEVNAGHTLTAVAASQVIYIEANEFFSSSDEKRRRALTQLMVAELMERKTRITKLERKQQRQQANIQKIESLALLGELSAGVAHELNNAIAVIAGSSSWMETNIQELLLKNMKPIVQQLYNHGLEKGRNVSTDKESILKLQEQTKLVMSKSKLSFPEARKISQLNLDNELLKQVLKEKSPLELIKAWELGATIRDMVYSSKQATHVVRSMRELGQSTQEMTDNIDINDTIDSALTILHNRTKKFDLFFKSEEDLLMNCNSGELIQVWTNIIKNACDALTGDCSNEQPTIKVKSYKEDGNIVVQISNNGPKIPDAILPKIFKPNVSTKKSGHSFGLGIGLTLVQRIIGEHQGSISVHSDEEITSFSISLPSADTQMAMTSI